jgi:hypothetical protein
VPASKWHIRIVHYGALEVRDVGAVPAAGGATRRAASGNYPELSHKETQKQTDKEPARVNYICLCWNTNLKTNYSISVFFRAEDQ